MIRNLKSGICNMEHYSARRATTGSARVARWAGMNMASIAIDPINRALDRPHHHLAQVKSHSRVFLADSI